MKKLVFGVLVVTAAFLMGRVSAQYVEPSCPGCQATRISGEEIQEYVDVGRADNRVDQQVRSLDVGKSNVQLAVAHRGALDEPRPQSVASHSLVTEVYVVLSGSATNRTGPSLVGRHPRPADNYAVQFLNGPGANSADIENAETHELQAGDVFVIPAGTGHQFTKIDDHITYLMVRVDPDKVVPLMDEAASRAYLAERQ
jgi:mannose-6-phosphate isomerase-like protein (cupin superfamily)